jgi:hypothetical protein
MAKILSIPAPSATLEDGTVITEGLLVEDPTKPVTVKVGPVTLGDVTVGVQDLKTFSVYVVRIAASGATEQIWDKEKEAWVVPDDLPADKWEVTSLQAKPDDPAAPWSAEAFLMGAETKFEAASDKGYPRYAFRATFTTAKGVTGSSGAPSAAFTHPGVPGEDTTLAGLKGSPDLTKATKVDLFLRTTPGGAYVGWLTIESSGKVTVQNQAGAAVTLNPDGSISLRPGGGEGVVVQGNLTVTGNGRVNGDLHVVGNVT